MHSKIIFIFLLLTYKSGYSQDTSSLNYKVNTAILESIKKMPPIIESELYMNGKKKQKRYSFNLVSDKKKIAIIYKNKNKIKIDTNNIKPTDSFSFEIKYKKNIIVSQKYSIEKFVHGGKFIAGLITNYDSERKKYLNNTLLYGTNNIRNYLYYFIGIKMKNVETVKANRLTYSVVKSNSTPWTDFKSD